MAQDPLRPKDNGKIGLPRVSEGMNKIATKRGPSGGKGSKKDDENTKLGEDDAEAQKLLARARKRMERAIQAEMENRKAALDDLKFKAGDQWPSDVKGQREQDRRPCLTINKIPTFVHQITNDQRQNRPAINVSPVGEKGDREVAKMYRGLIRAIERESSADIAYDTAYDNAVSNGFGYFRILTEYESPDSFDQSIVIKRIRNPFTVYLDPDHQEPDGADAKWAFVAEDMSRHEFEETWPDADPMPFTQGGLGDKYKSFGNTQDSIRIAEYFEISHDERTLVALDNGHVGWEDELSDKVKSDIQSGKIEVVRKRKSQVPQITWYKITAAQILQEKKWVGKWIPIVKVIGDEVDIEGKVKLSGVIRFAKDPQRMYNYWRTAETEAIALTPKAPWIMEEGQVEGHETQWKQANTKSYPYLLYKATDVKGRPAPPPQRQPFAGAPAGVIAAIQGAAQDMIATTGIRFDGTMNERMVDESGRAIRELRRNGDVGNFHFIDNLARSLKHCGRILIDLIPKIYNTKRMITILREDDTEERVQLDPNAAKPMLEARHPQTGKTLKIFNPKYGEYGVTVTTGPSYATKRIEAAESMMAFAKAMPNTAAMIADLIAKNQDWPGADEMARRLAKAVPPNLLTPDQKDIPPQVQAIMQAMDQQIKQLGAERQQLIAALTEKMSERAIAQDKINKDFEAKLLAVVQKAEANFNTHIGAQLKELGQNVTLLMHAIESGSVQDAAQAAHAEAQQPSTSGGTTSG